MAVLAAGVPGLASPAEESDSDVVAETRATTYSRVGQNGWQASTGRDDELKQTPTPTSSITIRAYDGFDNLKPYHGDMPAYGVNVTAQIETCPNGTTRISKLNIGGWPYDVDGDCSDYRRGSRVEVAQADSVNQDDGAEADDIETTLVCDPATWRCRTAER